MDLLLHPQTAKELTKLERPGVYIVHGGNGLGKTTAVLEMLARHRPQILAPEPTTIKLASIQDVTKSLHLTAWSEGLQVTIIDQADTMTEAAQNALLKTLEELPPYAAIVLITDELNRLLPTVVSRAHAIYFVPPTNEQLTQWAKTQSKGRDVTDLLDHAQGSPARLRSLLSQGVVPEEVRERLEQIEKLFSASTYEALAAAQALQAALPEVLDDIIAYVRRQLRENLDESWLTAAVACQYAEKLQQANSNKRYILDVIALKLRPQW